MIAEGRTNDEIGAALSVASSAVAGGVRRLRAKLGARNGAHAVGNWSRVVHDGKPTNAARAFAGVALRLMPFGPQFCPCRELSPLSPIPGGSQKSACLGRIDVSPARGFAYAVASGRLRRTGAVLAASGCGNGITVLRGSYPRRRVVVRAFRFLFYEGVGMTRIAKSFGFTAAVCSFGVAIGYFGAKAWEELVRGLM